MFPFRLREGTWNNNERTKKADLHWSLEFEAFWKDSALLLWESDFVRVPFLYDSVSRKLLFEELAGFLVSCISAKISKELVKVEPFYQIQWRGSRFLPCRSLIWLNVEDDLKQSGFQLGILAPVSWCFKDEYSVSSYLAYLFLISILCSCIFIMLVNWLTLKFLVLDSI